MNGIQGASFQLGQISDLELAARELRRYTTSASTIGPPIDLADKLAKSYQLRLPDPEQIVPNSNPWLVNYVHI